MMPEPVTLHFGRWHSIFIIPEPPGDIIAWRRDALMARIKHLQPARRRNEAP